MTVPNPLFFDGQTWGQPHEMVEHRETHAAHVFLCGTHAYKIKKPVHYSYLDFSTLGRRRAVIERELEINSLFTPELYLSTATVLGEPVLILKRFDEQLLLANVVARQQLDEGLCRGLASMMAISHQIAQVRKADGAEIVSGLGKQLTTEFSGYPEIFEARLAQQFSALYTRKFGKCRRLLQDRAMRGFVRRCHGDAHCGNIVLYDGKSVLFDAIEFSETIATVDVLYDLAFLLMDLMRFGQVAAANAVLNHYLDLRHAEENLGGLALLSLFLSIRAGVRAIVAADRMHELEDGEEKTAKRLEAQNYFTACVNYLREETPRLICIGGFSGTGKSTLARSLAPFVPPPPGAIVVRSDVERKRLAGIDPAQHLPSDNYTKQAAEQVYSKVMHRGRAALEAGMPVILDAVFLREADRSGVENSGSITGGGIHGHMAGDEPRNHEGTGGKEIGRRLRCHGTSH